MQGGLITVVRSLLYICMAQLLCVAAKVKNILLGVKTYFPVYRSKPIVENSVYIFQEFHYAPHVLQD